MRLFLKIILSYFLWTPQLIGQHLKKDFYTLAEKHDMMGGALITFYQNKIIDTLYYGKADYKRTLYVNNKTKFRIASISKIITAMAAMQLAEKGYLNLDEDISNILGYPIINPNHTNTHITSKMLLSHRSSVIDGVAYDSFLMASGKDPVPNLSELLTPKGTYYTTVIFSKHKPGSYFDYANINFVILGTIIEKISGQRFDEYCLKNILQPLGMNASFNVNDLENINEVAVLYRKSKNSWVPQFDDYHGKKPIYKNLDDYLPGTNGARFGPQGGLRCSALDLAQLLMYLMNPSDHNIAVLQPESISTMLDNHWSFDEKNGNSYNGLFRSWGLGIHRITSTPKNDIIFSKSKSLFGHAGEAYGLFSDAFADPENKIGLVFITNGIGRGDEQGTNSSFYKIEEEIFNAIENSDLFKECCGKD